MNPDKTELAFCCWSVASTTPAHSVIDKDFDARHLNLFFFLLLLLFAIRVIT